MRNRFFKYNTELQFSWNAAAITDWPRIQRNFVSAYLSSYQECRYEALMFDESLKKAAEQKWETAYRQGYEKLLQDIIEPLEFYLGFNRKSGLFETERASLNHHFRGNANVDELRDTLIKLTMLRSHFESEFLEEKHKIESKTKKIDYLMARFHDQPIAFFVCELNYKSAKIYLRFVTIEPAFHRLGLGEKMLDQIAHHYPQALGMELYTRKANIAAQSFYKHYGFLEFQQFDFWSPTISLKKSEKLFFPEDDSTSQPNAFIAFSKDFESKAFSLS